LKFTIEHCTEGYLIADLLKEDGICPIVGPLISERSKIELRNQTIKAPALLAKKGIKFAIMTDHPVIPIQYLPVSAALAVREGLDEKEALKAITIYAAQLSGIDQHVGSLEIGKDADLVIWSGHPFEYKTKANKVMINGKIVFE
jgi:imidazolonepropionase-like amidohydrolase